jgi:hypothetical protein
LKKLSRLCIVSEKPQILASPTRRRLISMKCGCTANKAIACTVGQCKNHCEGENYCSLNQIQVGTHEANPTVDQCTDCMSFEKK